MERELYGGDREGVDEFDEGGRKNEGEQMLIDPAEGFTLTLSGQLVQFNPLGTFLYCSGSVAPRCLSCCLLGRLLASLPGVGVAWASRSPESL